MKGLGTALSIRLLRRVRLTSTKSLLRPNKCQEKHYRPFSLKKDDLDGSEGQPKSSISDLLDFSAAISEEIKAVINQDLRIFPNFISEEEQGNILQEIEPYLQRMRYEFDHWDDAIHGFRETERLRWNQRNKEILTRVTETALPPGLPPLQHVHILDLAPTGVIKPHIDSIRFCGNTISGLSLLSDSVMRLVHEIDKDLVVTARLPCRSLYVMTNSIRYEYTHAVLEDKESFFRGEKIPRKRRISIICRNEPPPPSDLGSN